MSDAEEEVYSEESDVDDACDVAEDVPEGLSHVGGAAYTALATGHPKYKGVCWNTSSGRVVGSIAQTPPMQFWESQIEDDCKECHSDEFPARMGGLMSQGARFVDFASLGPPDGKFLEAMKDAVRSLHESGNEVVVRILTGNIIGMPTDNSALCKQVTEGLGEESSIKLWVGSWRKGVSWNHAKIIAVDGEKLFTGGHNVWDPHYLQWNPVRDLSFEVEGQVSQDGHAFVNRMWKYVAKRDQSLKSSFGIGDFKPSILKSNVSVAKWPKGIDDYPPMYEDIQESIPLAEARDSGNVPMVTMGRYGALHHDDSTANPSDAAIVAMLSCAEKSLKLCLQDLGPLAIPLPTGPMSIPGGVWPKEYLQAIGKSLFERGADVHIVLSNPNSIPADLGMTDANYGNGWTCEDVASEIIKAVKEVYPDESDEARLSGLVECNLKVTYMRSTAGGADWADVDGKCGNHAKFFIVDDKAFYIGSQNLYIANLAEWGILVDDEEQTQKILEEYWSPLWRQSYESLDEGDRDLDVGKVLEGCGIDRQLPPDADMTDEEWELVLLRKKAGKIGGTERKLCVWLISASGLRDADGLGSGSSDSYVRLRVVDEDGRTVGVPQESQVIWDGGANPTWNQQFEFEGLDKPCAYTLKLSVLDKDSLLGLKGDVADWLAAEDELGSARFSLCDLDNCLTWQHREIMVADGWFQDSSLKVAFNTCGRWGN